MKFADLGLAESLLRAVTAEGYHTATPVQIAAIPPVLAGRDVLACAKPAPAKPRPSPCPRSSGSAERRRRPDGRGRKIRVLVLSPTRELARQICESFQNLRPQHHLQRSTVVYGGVGQGPQVQALRNGVDMLVATPGRLVDLMQQGPDRSGDVQVVDSRRGRPDARHGFCPRPGPHRASASRSKRQTLLFSATMPGEIRKLADAWLTRSGRSAQWRRWPRTAEHDRRIGPVRRRAAEAAAAHPLAAPRPPGRARWSSPGPSTGPTRLPNRLVKSGIAADAIHANKSQSARQKALARFKSSKPPVLVATDIAARGLDIDAVSHVINFDLPLEAGQLRPPHRPHGPGGGDAASRSRSAPGPNGPSCEPSSGLTAQEHSGRHGRPAPQVTRARRAVARSPRSPGAPEPRAARPKRTTGVRLGNRGRPPVRRNAQHASGGSGGSRASGQGGGGWRGRKRRPGRADGPAVGRSGA